MHAPARTVTDRTLRSNVHSVARSSGYQLHFRAWALPVDIAPGRRRSDPALGGGCTYTAESVAERQRLKAPFKIERGTHGPGGSTRPSGSPLG
jgi:hypothetical protein